MVYEVEALRREYQKGNFYKYIFFWSSTPPADGGVRESCLSQWWNSEFEDENGVKYCCAEQYMMAEKARMFQDKQMLEAIMRTRIPKEMKAYGRAVQGFDKEQWDKACYDIVKKGNRFKFSQNAELWNYLKSTKNRILVEASPRDRIWGIGMGKSNPDVENPQKWRGRNLLGFALTEIRDVLLEEEMKGTEKKDG